MNVAKRASKILIVDDHPIVRHGLAKLINDEPDLEACGEADSAGDAMSMMESEAPDLLLVDEPVAGLTDEETERTGELLISLAESHSIIVIEHDMEFVRQIAQGQVTVLHQGSVLCEGQFDQVQSDPRVIEVYLGQPAEADHAVDSTSRPVSHAATADAIPAESLPLPDFGN